MLLQKGVSLPVPSELKNNRNVFWLRIFLRWQCRATTCNSIHVLLNPYYSVGIERQDLRQLLLKFSVSRELDSCLSLAEVGSSVSWATIENAWPGHFFFLFCVLVSNI